MIKVNDMLNIDDYADLKEKSLISLIQVPEINAFFKQHHLNTSLLKKHWIEFLEYRDDLDLCKGCKGIESCPKHNLGMQKVLSLVDDEVHLDVQVCHFGNDLNARNSFLNHYVVKNVRDDLLLTSFKDIELIQSEHMSPNEKNTLVSLYKYIKEPTNNGFFIWGEGSLKTELLAAMLHDVFKQGDTAAFVNIPAYIIDMKSSFKSNNASYDLDDLLHVKYLVLDGMGEENITAWSRDEIISSIISYRRLNGLPTFITSIFTFDELKQRYTLKKEDTLNVKALISNIKSMTKELMVD